MQVCAQSDRSRAVAHHNLGLHTTELQTLSRLGFALGRSRRGPRLQLSCGRSERRARLRCGMLLLLQLYWHKIQVEFLTQSTLHSSDSFQKKHLSCRCYNTVKSGLLLRTGSHSSTLSIWPHVKKKPVVSLLQCCQIRVVTPYWLSFIHTVNMAPCQKKNLSCRCYNTVKSAVTLF